MSVPAEHMNVTPLPVLAAARLQEALKDHGITADVHDGYGLALVSVRVGLVVWCDSHRYWWRTGGDTRRKSVMYAWHPVIEPVRAARRVAFRCAELSRHHPHSQVVDTPAPSTRSGDQRVR